MPSKKKKYNARFPAGRIKKIMQMDDDVGKIAHGVPVVISRSVELFVNSLLQQTANITRERNAKTLSQAHFKLCVLKEQKFDFLKDLVKNIEDVSPEEEKKSSKANHVLPASSNFEHDLSINHNEEHRKRVRIDPDLEESSSQKRNKRLTKRRFFDPNSAYSASNNTNEASSSIVQLNADHNSHYDITEVKSEPFDSPDLVIDEDCDT